MFPAFITSLLYYAFGEKVFSLNICKAAPKEMALQASSAYKRQELWREPHTPLWPLIGHIIFLTREKSSYAILIGRIIFFT